jgi:hypothetical protein
MIENLTIKCLTCGEITESETVGTCRGCGKEFVPSAGYLVHVPESRRTRIVDDELSPTRARRVRREKVIPEPSPIIELREKD